MSFARRACLVRKAWACISGLLLCASLHASSLTVEAIRKTGALTCGIDQSEAEFSSGDEHGSRFAFDRDLCTAVAVAILGPHPQVVIRGYPDNDTALQALQNHEVDLVATVSDDFSQSTRAGVSLTRPVLWDSRGFLVLHSSGVAHVADLNHKKICFLDQTETEDWLHSWFPRHGLALIAFPFQEQGEMEAAFVTGNCTALAGDLTRLANARAAFGSRAKDYGFLPEVLSADALATAYRSEDRELGEVIAWTENLLLAAEQMNLTSKNVMSTPSTADPILMRLSGSTHELGRPLGLDNAWTAHVVAAVGNFGEIFDRDLGKDSPLQIPRGENELWTAGGLMQPLGFE